MSDSIDPSLNPSPQMYDANAPLSPRDDLRLRRKNIAGLFKTSGSRAIILITGAVLLAAVGLSYLNISHTAPSSDQVAGGATVGGAPKVTHRPGFNETQEHAGLQQQANQSAYNQAISKNQSVVPVLTADTSNSGALTLPTQTPPVAPTQSNQISIPIAAPAPPTIPANRRLATNVPGQVANSQVQRAGNAGMNKQVLAYLNMWGPPGKPLTHQEFDLTGTKLKVENSSSLNQSNAGPSNAEKNAIRYVRAGTFIDGTLITPLDSDAPGPVLAQINAGPLAGARLIGVMKVQNSGILVSFTTISKPGWPSTYPITAVAMDQSDSTALATYINHHYVVKGMGIFGGAFLQGYGQAMQQQGQTSSITPVGGIVTQQNQLNAGQIAAVAEGSVASKVGNTLEKSTTNIQTTIRVKGVDGASFPIRILFMANF